jgi:Luciferase-like monooxygenase
VTTNLTKEKKRPRFGVILLPYNVSHRTILNAAQHAERLGFDSIWISDHIQRSKSSVLECWTTISALCAQTKKIRIGSLATCNSFRNPALLAKIVASSSQISDGRVDLALGIGYDELEFKAAGIRFSNFMERVEQLAETVEILNSLWSRKIVNFYGKYWQLDKSICEPKPKKPPRLWIAGRNESLMEIAAKRAYGLNILPYSGTLDERKLSTFDELKTITQSISSSGVKHKSLYCGDGGLIIGTDDLEYSKRVRATAQALDIPFGAFKKKLASLSVLHGTIENVASELQNLISLDFEEMMIVFPGWQIQNYENMDLFAEKFLH